MLLLQVVQQQKAHIQTLQREKDALQVGQACLGGMVRLARKEAGWKWLRPDELHPPPPAVVVNPCGGRTH